MSSPHWTICTSLETHLTTWAAENWASALVKADFLLERLTQLTGDENPTVIGLIPNSVEDQPDREARRFNDDLITINAIVIGRLADLNRSTLETIDTNTHALRNRLRAIFRIPIGSINAELERVSHPTPFDHNMLKSAELWASLITCEYSYDAGEVTEVAIA